MEIFIKGFIIAFLICVCMAWILAGIEKKICIDNMFLFNDNKLLYIAMKQIKEDIEKVSTKSITDKDKVLQQVILCISQIEEQREGIYGKK